MDRLLCVILLALLLGMPSLTLAAPALPALKFTLTTAVKSDRCDAIFNELKQQLASRGRFAVGDKAVHGVQVSCDKDGNGTALGVSWTFRHGSRTLNVARVDRQLGAEENVSPLLYQLASDLLQALPWDGEVLSVSKKQDAATLNLGTVNNFMLGSCLPVEIGALGADGDKTSFKRHTIGVLNAINDFSSTASIIKAKGKTPKNMTFRFTTADGNPKIEALVAQCRKATGSAPSRTISNFLARDFSSKDMEIRGITQMAGVYIMNLKADNDVSAPMVIAVHHTNRVQIGEYFTGIIRAFKDVTSGPYEQKLKTEAIQPFVAAGEAVLSLSLDFEPVTVSFGPALIFDKVNVPYIADDLVLPAGEGDPTSQRPAKVRGGMALGAFGSFEDLLIQSSLSFSTSAAKRYLGGELILDYRLFRTWLVGGGYRLINLGEGTNGEPGVSLNAMDLHVGFSIER